MKRDPLHTVTPLWLSEPLSAALGSEVWLKMDCFQPVGSFKLRGMGRMCQTIVEAGARRVVTSSGGNAGYAVAWAARALEVPATVVLPATTPEFLRNRIRSACSDGERRGETAGHFPRSNLEVEFSG